MEAAPTGDAFSISSWIIRTGVVQSWIVQTRGMKYSDEGKVWAEQSMMSFAVDGNPRLRFSVVKFKSDGFQHYMKETD